MLKDMKIGMRLGVGFTFVLVLMVVLSLNSIFRIGNIASSTDALAYENLPKIELVGDIQQNSMNIRLIVRNMLLSNDKSFVKSQIESIAKIRKANTESFEKLQSMIKSKEGKNLVEQVIAARTKYVRRAPTYAT